VLITGGNGSQKYGVEVNDQKLKNASLWASFDVFPGMAIAFLDSLVSTIFLVS